MLRMENTADACQGWWDAGWELWLLMEWRRCSHSWHTLVVPVPCPCHSQPVLLELSHLCSFIYTPPSSWCVGMSWFWSFVHHTQRTGEMLAGFTSEQ